MQKIRNEAAFNASSIQGSCTHRFSGRGRSMLAAVTACIRDESVALLARGGKLPARFAGTLLARMQKPSSSSRASGGMASMVSPISRSSLTPPNTLPAAMVSPVMAQRVPVAAAMVVTPVERSSRMADWSLIAGAGRAAVGSTGPNTGSGGGASGTFAGQLLNTGVNVLAAALAPSPRRGASNIAAPMAMMGRAVMSGAMMEAGTRMMGYVLGAGGRRTRVSARQVKSLVRLTGVEATSMALGLSIADTAYLATRPSRRRGISARDVRTTRRVVRFACNLSQSLCAIKPRARRTKCS